MPEGLDVALAEQEAEREAGKPHLRRALGQRDLVLLFVVAVLNLNTVPPVAAGGPVWAISSPQLSRPVMVEVAKTRMTFSVGGQGSAVLRSRMQSASAMHWSTIRWQVSALSVSWMIARSACSAWTACSSIRWVSS